jgi:hypothetical protein
MESPTTVMMWVFGVTIWKSAQCSYGVAFLPTPHGFIAGNQFVTQNAAMPVLCFLSAPLQDNHYK